MRRVATVLVPVLVLAGGGLLATATLARAPAAAQAAPPSLQADFDNNGFADLAAAPFEDVGARIDAGAFSAVYGVAGGLWLVGAQLSTQDSGGVPGTAETGDFFGGGLAVGDSGAAGTAAPAGRIGRVVR